MMAIILQVSLMPGRVHRFQPLRCVALINIIFNITYNPLLYYHKDMIRSDFSHRIIGLCCFLSMGWLMLSCSYDQGEKRPPEVAWEGIPAYRLGQHNIEIEVSPEGQTMECKASYDKASFQLLKSNYIKASFLEEVPGLGVVSKPSVEGVNDTLVYKGATFILKRNVPSGKSTLLLSFPPNQTADTIRNYVGIYTHIPLTPYLFLTVQPPMKQ